VDHDGSHIICCGRLGSATPGVVMGFGRMG
jgi:hypothetical protein